jgi:DNA repair protein RecO (recombination protein O)
VVRRNSADAAPPAADDVVVCGVVPYGDTDAIVRCFAREAGLVGAFARGARASKRRFAGLTVPVLGRVQWRPRRSGDLLELLDLDVDTRLATLGHDLRAWSFAGYVVELVERILPDGAPQPEFFDVVVSTLTTLAQPTTALQKSLALRALELQLLATLGVLPDLSGAADNPGEDVVAYDPTSGHLLAQPGPGSLPFGEHARKAAQDLLDRRHRAPGPDIDEQVLRDVAVLFGAWLRRHPVELRSVEVLRAVRSTVEL